jgi:hypothetical protein
MKWKVFISEKGKGWFEIDVPYELQASSYEKIGSWAYNYTRAHQYKGMLISENPEPYPLHRG